MENLPVAVIGAGPIGLAAAAHLLKAGFTPVVIERGAQVGAAMRAWGHVQMFSPWSYNIDKAARALLEPTGWTEPKSCGAPAGSELVEKYLEPLASLPQIAGTLRVGTRVLSIARQGLDKAKTAGREARPFSLRLVGPDGAETELLARAVIDASGTWHQPNPLGSDGRPAPGEAAAQDRIAYAIPDVLGLDRPTYAGQRTVVIGSGHSAINALLELAELKKVEPATRIVWAVRRAEIDSAFGGGAADQLAARGKLGTRAHDMVESGAVEVFTGFATQRLVPISSGIALVGTDGRRIETDRVIAATGFRPDLSITGELRLSLDPALDCPTVLGPLIDPNIHSCGSVRPHGALQLAHPERDYYAVGMKSYGRAPTFLMATGYEQVRSVVAAIAGDMEAAARVELELPETGVCSTRPRVRVAAGAPVPEPVGAVAVQEAVAAAGAACCG